MTIAPLEAPEFAALIGAFAPFEPAPRLAIAVSGGADSLALTLLAQAWAAVQGGAVTALTVDHGLRPEAAAEASQVGTWLSARGIEHRILAWRGPLPSHGIQAAARKARFRLLEEWCADAGVLHLLLAHHQDDQAETLLLRLMRGSGSDGLAGMSADVERAQCRVLRPLLPVPRARLVATLHRLGQSWIEDPSNRDHRYARARLRQGLTPLAEAGLTSERLAAAAARLGRVRAALEAEVARLLARCAAIDPAGFARLDVAVLAAAPAEIGARALAALLLMVSGAAYPPRGERLERLYRRLAGGGLAGGSTLGGCRILPRRGGVLVCREPAGMAPPVTARPGAAVTWDGRFRLRMPAGAPAGLSLGAAETRAGARRLPFAACLGMPALRDDTGDVVTLPVLGSGQLGGAPPGSLLFRPRRPLTGAGFTVV
ncbi:MAG TPA: tRNA lysidine(34) synthetase TilS [Stellaceae bacterium]|nr:tRNA lysidine(34) synthetase TilS [Stellaceae bacterium]